jgi:hypothetical protein
MTSKIILERISLALGSLLNCSKFIKYYFFVAFNLCNFGFMIKVIIGSSFIQAFLGLYSILIVGYRVFTLWFHINWHKRLTLKLSSIYPSIYLSIFKFSFVHVLSLIFVVKFGFLSKLLNLSFFSSLFQL